MKSIRINNRMRETLVRYLTRKLEQKIEDKKQWLSRKYLSKVYKELVGGDENLALLNKLPKTWTNTERRVCVRSIPGLNSYTYLYCEGNDRLTMVPKGSSYINYDFLPFREQLKKDAGKVAILEEELKSTKREILNVVNRCNSTNQLLTEWPECKKTLLKLFTFPGDKPKTTVVAVYSDMVELNKKLGLK